MAYAFKGNSFKSYHFRPLHWAGEGAAPPGPTAGGAVRGVSLYPASAPSVSIYPATGPGITLRPANDPGVSITT